MRDAYGVAKVRAAEAALMAKVPEGTLMQRAAAGLASVCAGMLRGAQGGGRVYGARVVVLAGTGDNGGDALYAGALLARRGAAVTAILAGPRAHPGGRAALRAAGGRVLAIVPWAVGGAGRAGEAGKGARAGAPAAPESRGGPAPPDAETRVDLPELPLPDLPEGHGGPSPRGGRPAEPGAAGGDEGRGAPSAGPAQVSSVPETRAEAAMTEAGVAPGRPGAAPTRADVTLTRADLPRPRFEAARAEASSRSGNSARSGAGAPSGTAEPAASGSAETLPDIGRVARYAPGNEVRRAIGQADLVIDGLLGIGGRGGLRDPYATLAQLAADCAGLVVAVDLPSGIDADTGAVEGPAVRADVTVTFGAVKPGLLIDPGARQAGVVELVDIGLGPYLERPDASAPQAADIAALVPEPGPDSDKYRRGVVGLLAGSERFTGAAVLATGGATHGGAGMVRLVTAGPAATAVRLAWPEAVITELTGPLDFPGAVGRVQAWVAGPGMGVGTEAAGRLEAVLRTGLPVLVDADGLTLLAGQPGLLPRPAPTLLTPHAGELGRLLSADPADVEGSRLEHARAAAKKFGACVLLKGSTTVIAPPETADPVLVNTTGTPWLATAGTGDVLSGLAGALLAQGLLPPQAAITAAYLHGLAARLAASGDPAGGRAGEAPLGASDVLRALPSAFRAVGAAHRA